MMEVNELSCFTIYELVNWSIYRGLIFAMALKLVHRIDSRWQIVIDS